MVLTRVIVRVGYDIDSKWILIKVTHGVGELKTLFPNTTRWIIKWQHIKEL